MDPGEERADMLRMNLARVFLFLCASILFYLVPWNGMSRTSVMTGQAFLFAYAVLGPGLALRFVLFPSRKGLVEKLVSASFFGLSYLLGLSFLWALAGGHLGGFVRLLPILLLPALVLQLLVHPRPPALDELEERKPLQRGGAAVLILIAVVSLALLFVLRAGPPVGYTKDTLDHVGYVEEIRSSGDPFPENSIYLDAGKNGKDLRKGLLHFLYAASAQYLFADTLRYMGWTNGFMAALLILSVYASMLLAFRDARMAVVAALFFIAATGGDIGSLLRGSIYTNKFGIAFYLFFIASATTYMGDGRPRHLVSSALFAFAAGAVHILFAILAGLAVFTMLVWKICFPRLGRREHLARTFRLGVACAGAILPYLVFRYLDSYQGSNALHKEIQGVLFLGDHLFVANPFVIWGTYGLFGLFTFLSIVPLWKIRGEHPALGFLIASALTVPLLLFNPFVEPLIYRVMSYLSNRLIFYSPLYMLGAFFVSRASRGAAGGGGMRKSSTVLALAIALVFVVNLVQSLYTAASFAEKIDSEKRRSFLAWKVELDLLAATLPSGSLVVSDPITSYSISALGGHYVLCTLDQHAPPNDLELERRIIAAREIISPYVSIGRTTRLLEENGARYIAINGRLIQPPQLHFWSLDPRFFSDVSLKFSSHAAFFQKVIESDRFEVYRWNGIVAEEEAIRNPLFLDSIPDTFTPVERKTGEATLDGFRMDGTKTARGETITGAFLWSGNRSYEPGNYSVVVRFDKKQKMLPLGGKPFSKPWRKVMESIRGKRMRFRREHKIACGFLSPDTWPNGVHVVDEFAITIPKNIEPGRYGVRVKLVKKAFQPIYDLRDVLYDEDRLQGIEIAEIDIE